MNKRKRGSRKEALAAAYLKQQGVEIVCQNYQVRQGEIDLIGWESAAAAGQGLPQVRTLLFIEVKYRRDAAAGYAQEAVSYAKQRQISRVSLFYLHQKGIGPDVSIRYDVVAINGEHVTWLKDAFAYAGPLSPL